MASNPYDDGRLLAELYGRLEYALKRTDFLRGGRDDAQADWNKFARALGPEFFEHVRQSGLADTLISEPPRKLMAEDLDWQPAQPKPLKNVIELFEMGVCRVRNSYVHGEKFIGESVRDATLVAEALAVLREAEQRVPAVAAVLRPG